MMKKQTLFVFGIVLAALVAAPMVVLAQSQSAQLQITGTVPNIVRIGFGTVGTDGTIAIGDLNANSPSGISTTDSTLVYAGNVDFDISVTSANGGTLDYDTSGGAAPAGFATSVGYTVTVDGNAADLTGATAVVTATAGIYQAVNVVVATDPLGVDGLNGSSTLGDIEAAGSYKDTLTFTISAAP